MALNFKNFIKQINKINYFEENAKIAVGVSGGVDSITLLYLLSLWSKKRKLNVTALIVDHKLRNDSSLEAKEVSNYLTKIKVNNQILVLKKNSSSGGIQKRARLSRLNAMHNYCIKRNIIHLFLGHHLDDNLETFILRKIAGSSFEGLNSIKILSIYKNIEIIRPLLKFSKKEIIHFAKTNKLKWINDPSNQNIAFSRVKVRKIIEKDDQIKLKINKQLKGNQNLYTKYTEMINYNLCYVISQININSVELDKNILKKLPYEIGIKILERSVNYIKKNSYNFKYKKLRPIYFKILNEKGNFQTQNTFFSSIYEKIIISSIK